MAFEQPVACTAPWCRVLYAMIRHGPVTFRMLDRKTQRIQVEWQSDHDSETAIGEGADPMEAFEQAYKQIRH